MSAVVHRAFPARLNHPRGLHLSAPHVWCTAARTHTHTQGRQLLELLQLLPAHASEQRVELCSHFWARLTDRAHTWSDVMRALTPEQQVRVSLRACIMHVQA
jgi:hypothetical protein